MKTKNTRGVKVGKAAKPPQVSLSNGWFKDLVD
jgi:hypothetical protein